MNGSDNHVPEGTHLADENGWDSVATFIVEYQTRTQDQGEHEFKTLVTQMEVEQEASISEQEWSGLQEQAPSEWMGGRLAGILAALGFSK